MWNDLWFILPGSIFILGFMLERLTAHAEVSIEDGMVKIKKSHRIRLFGGSSHEFRAHEISHIARMTRGTWAYHIYYTEGGETKRVSLDSFEVENIGGVILRIEAARFPPSHANRDADE